jgi:hypothetical protein
MPQDSSTKKKISPVTIMVMLRKAKTKYQTTKVDPKSEAETRHNQIVVELKKLRDIAKAADKGADKEDQFKRKRKDTAKLMRKHWELLAKEKTDDPNKGRLDKYRMMIALMTLKVKALQLKAAEQCGEEKDEEAADPEDLQNEVVDITAMSRPDDFEQDVADESDEEVVSVAPTSTAPPPKAPEPPPAPKEPAKGPKVAEAQGKLVALQQARLAWDAARKKVAAELKTLQATILATFKGDADFQLAVTAAQNLQQKWTEIDGQLYSKLEEGLAATDPTKRDSCHADAKTLVDQCLTKVTSDEVLKSVDKNPFVPVAVFQTLNATLTVLSNKLKA